MNFRLGRRRFTTLLAGSLALLARPHRGRADAVSAGKEERDFVRVCAGAIGDPASVIAIGRACGGRAADVAALRAALGYRSSWSEADLGARVARVCEAEFAAGEIVTVEGWVVSRTERSICAAAAEILPG